MKALILIASVIFSSTLLAFESGRYHGESEEQKCDVELEVKTNSILFKRIDCTNFTLNFSISLDAPLEFTYGHHEGDLDDGFKYSAYLSQTKYQLNESESDGRLIYSEYMDDNGSGSIRYKFVIGGQYDIFDLVLNKENE